MSTTMGTETTSAGQPHGLEPTKKEILAGSPRRSTGPRTERGKQRSRYNALKHGIFSKVLLLEGESSAEYESLMDRLRESLEPEGTLEETLVEKLATNLWRYRRLIAAESAEIRGSIRFANWSPREQAEAGEIKVRVIGVGNWRGLIHDIDNADVLNQCLELLSELRQGIETMGFSEKDSKILKRVYGDRRWESSGNDLYDEYMKWDRTVKADDAGQLSKAASPEECKQHILRCIDDEIKRLRRNHKARMAIEAERKLLEELRRHVPGSFSSDRLLRYEASLERSFDRTLSQLERLQRMRLGQPVLPPVKVELST